MKTIAAKEGYWFTGKNPSKLRLFYKVIRVADGEDHTERFVEWSDEERKQYMKETFKISLK